MSVRSDIKTIVDYWMEQHEQNSSVNHDEQIVDAVTLYIVSRTDLR